MPTHYQGTAQEVLALNTFIRLTRAVESLTSRLARCGTQGDLTPTQFGVLETLYHLGPLCPGELSAKLLKSSGNITLVIDNLEKRGLVIRRRETEDRRMIKILLTQAGHELIDQILPAHVAAIVKEMSVLNAEEQDTLGSLCRRVGMQEST